MAGWRFVLRIVRRRPWQAEAGLIVRKCSSRGGGSTGLTLSVEYACSWGSIWSCASAVGGEARCTDVRMPDQHGHRDPFFLLGSVDVFVLKG